MSREVTNRLIEMMEIGLINPNELILMCLNYMSEDDVADMARANEIFEAWGEGES